MIVGISGYKGSGKDTFADILFKEYNFQKISFAEKLKTSAAALFNIDPRLWETYKNDKEAIVTISAPTASKTVRNIISNMTVRSLLQRYGTEAHREVFGDDFWVNELFKTIGNGDYSITDVRFENEARRIKSHGGVIVRINRFENTEDTHASEQLIPESYVDYWIDNTSTLDNLKEEAFEFINWLGNEEIEDIYS